MAASTCALRPAAHVTRHPSRQQHNHPLSDRRKDTQSLLGSSEQLQPDACDEGSKGRISNVAPIQLACIHENVELVTVETILPIQQGMDKHAKGGQQEQNACIT